MRFLQYDGDEELMDSEDFTGDVPLEPSNIEDQARAENSELQVRLKQLEAKVEQQAKELRQQQKDRNLLDEGFSRLGHFEASYRSQTFDPYHAMDAERRYESELALLRRRRERDEQHQDSLPPAVLVTGMILDVITGFALLTGAFLLLAFSSLLWFGYILLGVACYNLLSRAKKPLASALKTVFGSMK